MEYLLLILNSIDAATKTYISNVVAQLARDLNATFRYLLILFFMLYGFAVWRGVIKADAIAYFWTVVKISVIYYLIFTWSVYNALIVNFLINSPDTMAGQIVGTGMVGTGATSATGVIATAYDRSLGAASIAYGAKGTIMPFVLGSIILFSATIVLFLSILLISLSKVALAVLVALGPIAIMLLLFESTKKFFESWLQQCINFGLINLLTIMVLALTGTLYVGVIDTLNTTIDGTSTSGVPLLTRGKEVTLNMVIPILFVGLLISLILKQVPAIASAIAGGVQISTLGVESAPGQAFSNILNRNAMSRSMRGGPGLVGRAGRAMKGVSSRAGRAMKGASSRVAQMVKRLRS